MQQSVSKKHTPMNIMPLSSVIAYFGEWRMDEFIAKKHENQFEILDVYFAIMAQHDIDPLTRIEHSSCECSGCDLVSTSDFVARIASLPPELAEDIFDHCIKKGYFSIDTPEFQQSLAKYFHNTIRWKSIKIILWYLTRWIIPSTLRDYRYIDTRQDANKNFSLFHSVLVPGCSNIADETWDIIFGVFDDANFDYSTPDATNSLMHDAIRCNQLHVIKCLSKRGVKVNQHDVDIAVKTIIVEQITSLYEKMKNLTSII
jgi:hypothetical protein